SLSKLINASTGHTNIMCNIDYSIFNNDQFICSGSNDETIRVCVLKIINKFNHLINIQVLNYDATIHFWDFKNNQQLQVFNEHTSWIGVIEFSPFNGGRYLCSGSADKLFVYGMLKHLNHYMFLMDMKTVFGVWIFHHYKIVIMIIKVMILE
ncbi:WD repeat-containing protein, partial [Reticulomyxa filosa]